MLAAGLKKATRPREQRAKRRMREEQRSRAIKYLMAELGWAEQEKFWLSILTFSQIFSPTTLPSPTQSIC